MMTNSLRQLLTGLIDYAGLFPPARLPLNEAIRLYAKYCRDADSWMLGRFICQANTLGELEEFGDTLFAEETPLLVSALGRGSVDCDRFLEDTAVDCQSIESFRRNMGDRGRVDMFEVRLPEDYFSLSEHDGVTFLQKVVSLVSLSQTMPIHPFFEIARDTAWHDRVNHLCNVLEKLNREMTCRAGFKLRCGGLEAAAFPTTEQIAHFLHQCHRHDVPFKATAGLHHPLRHFSPEVQTTVHGFFNVFGAALLTRTHDLPPSEIESILTAEAASAFTFTDAEFSWGKWRIATNEIAELRMSWHTSFGSCSFDEPRDDLRALGLL